MTAPQKMTRRRNHFVDRNFEQPVVGLAMMRKSCLALLVPQHDGLCAERPSPHWICWSEEAHNRDAQRCGNMQRPGVAGDHQPRATCECDQLSNTAIKSERTAFARRNHGLRESIFIRTSIDERFQIMPGERSCDFTKTFGGPLLAAPAGAGIYDGKACE